MLVSPMYPTKENKQERRVYTAIPSMVADTEYKKELSRSVKTSPGMDSLPLTTYNWLVNYYLSCGKLREAMFMVCMANWGSRFGDTVRVRFCHIFDENGAFKDSFMFNEEKTGKMNIYYNNSAVRKVIAMYLDKNPREYYDYLFVSESRNKSRITLREIEIQERFWGRIEAVEEKIKSLSDQRTTVLNVFGKGIITDTELTEELEKIRRDKAELEKELNALKESADKFVCKAPNISIQKPMGRAAAEVFIKTALKELNIITKNRLDKDDKINTDKKFNTHSLRKLFGEQLYKTGSRLNAEGITNIDMAMLQIVQDKYMHSSRSITGRYLQAEESVIRDVCMHMNLGLNVLELYSRDKGDIQYGIG